MAEAEVTGFTAQRMLEIEETTVVAGEVVGDDLVLQTRGGVDIPAGNVRGPLGNRGPVGIETVIHGANAAYARPEAGIVHWIGSVYPSNAIANDFLTRKDLST